MDFVLGKTIADTFLKRINQSHGKIAFLHRSKVTDARKWNEVTFGEFEAECRLVSYGLMSLGVKPGDRVVILSNTRYEWSLCDMAILGCGAVTVPIYPSSTGADIAHICKDAEPKVALIEDARQLRKLREQGVLLEKIILIDTVGVTFDKKTHDLTSLDELKALGTEAETRQPRLFVDNLRAARPSDLLTISYTSGTSGVPKGVMLTHENMMSVLEDCVKALGNHVQPDKDVILSFLPFSHILGKVESVAIYTFGWQQAYAESLERFMSNIQVIRPTILFAVPRTFEKAQALIDSTAWNSPSLYQRLFQWASESGESYIRATEGDRSPSLSERANYLMAKSLVFNRLANIFGGRLKFAICGGAPLHRGIAERFKAMGLQILEGYGLTETCGPVTLNTPEQYRFGTVGRPLPDVTIKIASDGEILLRSHKIFAGYHKIPEETEEALRDGWFHTGDLGRIDAGGFLHITGRKKDLVITAGGKNVAPQKIENLAKHSPWISHFFVHGDERNYLTALVTLHPEEVIRYANENQILFSEYSELIRNPRIVSVVQKAIDEMNRQLASYETVKKFIILPNDFTLERGELTPSLKLKRATIEDHYRDLLGSMYGRS